jgi:hypothetical protein
MIPATTVDKIINEIKAGLTDPDFDLVNWESEIFLHELENEPDVLERLVALIDDDAFHQSQNMLAQWLTGTLEYILDSDPYVSTALRDTYVSALRRNLFKMKDETHQKIVSQILAVMLHQDQVFCLLDEFLAAKEVRYYACAFHLMKEYRHEPGIQNLQSRHVNAVKELATHDDPDLQRIGRWALDQSETN